jgi:serine/threonine protein kinase
MEISFDRSEVLGRGGYGKVFKGFWRDRPVAVKRIVLTSDEQEEKSLQRLDHENVIKLYHAERDENFR